MRIVHICLAGPVTDGLSYQDNMITKYHRKLGHEVIIITSQWIWGKDGNLNKTFKTNYFNEHGIKVYRLPIKGIDNHNRKFKKYYGLKNLLENLEPDILFIHNCNFIDIKIVTKYIKTRKSIKVYMDNHCDFSNSGKNILSKKILHGIIWKKYIKKIEPYVIKFYGVLPARVDFLTEIYGLPKEKCELLVMGVDDEVVESVINSNSKETIRREFNIKDNDFFIVTGGKIDQAKQQTLLLMEAVKELDFNIKLLVFGSVAKELESRVDQLVDGKKIHYIGWVNSLESYNYFNAADLVVFPGRHSVFWEQVAGQGIPMVCKYWEGTTHIDIGGNVIFLKRDSKEEIKDIIFNLSINSKRYNELRKNAQEFGKNSFSYQEIAKRSI